MCRHIASFEAIETAFDPGITCPEARPIHAARSERLANLLA
jgi:hypothetical protein